VRERCLREIQTRLRRDRGLARLGAPGLVEVVFWNGLGVGGIELGGLVEVVGEGLLDGLVVFPTVGPDGSHGPHGELGLRWSAGRMEEWGRGGFTDVGEDLGDGLRVGEEGNERERGLTGRADQGKGLVDACQQDGPSGRSGGGGVGWLGWCALWLGGRGRRSQGKFGIGAGDLSG
jgi:hypothetical protein